MKLIYTPTSVLFYSDEQSVNLRVLDVLERMANRVENHQLVMANDVESIRLFVASMAGNDPEVREPKVPFLEFERVLSPEEELEFVQFSHRLLDLVRHQVAKEGDILSEIAQPALSREQDTDVVVQFDKFSVTAAFRSELRSLELNHGQC